MIGALPLGYAAAGVVFASAIHSLPVVLGHNDAGIRRLAIDAAAVGVVFILYLRATRRHWTILALIAPVAAFAMAGAATLPVRVPVAPVLGNEYFKPYFNPRPHRRLEYPHLVDVLDRDIAARA
jgi:hypothetical protein